MIRNCNVKLVDNQFEQCHFFNPVPVPSPSHGSVEISHMTYAILTSMSMKSFPFLTFHDRFVTGRKKPNHYKGGLLLPLLLKLIQKLSNN